MADRPSMGVSGEARQASILNLQAMIQQTNLPSLSCAWHGRSSCGGLRAWTSGAPCNSSMMQIVQFFPDPSFFRSHFSSTVIVIFVVIAVGVTASGCEL
jgi:hypothetical protein